MKFAYRLFAWSLAVSIFFWIVTPDEPSLTLPAGSIETVSAAADRWVEELEAEFPCGYDVELRGFQDPESDVWGWTTWDDEREVYEIHFYTRRPFALVRETILHEYAHVLVWGAVQDTPHDGIYWAAYGNLYRFAIDE